MNQNYFNAVLSKRLKLIEKTLTIKGAEYARDGDCLSNFKRAAGIERIIPEKAWLGMFSKHLVSILDLIDDLDKGLPSASPAMWEEKIGDAMVYLVCLEALIIERIMYADDLERSRLISEAVKKSKHK